MTKLPLPPLALESTVITHGLPYPQNLETGMRLEHIARQFGAEPHTIAIIDGQMRAGLTAAELGELAYAGQTVRKLTRRDLPIASALKWTGATTVATTMWIAARNDIHVFSTGGIGGVHRTAGRQSSAGLLAADISADLVELSHTPVAVVCAGAKAVLDLPATLEWLETWGVPVIGYGTDEFPAFYSRRSGLPVDVRVDSPEEAAAIIQAKIALRLRGGVLICVPVPEDLELPPDVADAAISQALADAETAGVRGRATTPFLLARVAELTGEASVAANLVLLENNVRVGALIARALQRLMHQ